MINWLASLLILGLALQHMDNIAPFATGIPWQIRLLELCRGAAWVVLGLSAFVSIVRPLMPQLQSPMLHDTLPTVGIALVLLISEIRDA